jgi:hypothetical protein
MIMNQTPQNILSTDPNSFQPTMESPDFSLAGVNHAIPFPWKLHGMLDTAEMECFTSVVSWLPDGNSFKVHSPEVFVDQVMARYFKQTKYKSFQRQLNMWGFERLLVGPEKGGYSHAHFVRGKPALCRHMKRLKIKGTGNKRSGSPVPTQTVSRSESPTIPSQTNSMLSLTSTEQQQHSSTQVFHQTAPVRALDVSDHRHASDAGDFDVNTLLEVLSSAIGNTQNPIAPENGDNVLFEGKSFFFVEDYHPPEDSTNTTSTTTSRPRHLSIELSFQADRRLSILESIPQGARLSIDSTPTQVGAGGRQSRRFSLSQTFKNPSRQPRRFSIERAPQSQTGRQSRRFTLERSAAPENYVLKEIQSMTAV